ncbi:MAG TPA: hypothetical protein ENJ30_06350 [Desulfobulbaceae bacterium]|nr:hypothetical protein [Desulfobulbaceae bacterium]
MAELHGVTVVLKDKDVLTLSGTQHAVERVITDIRRRKKEIIACLQAVEPLLKPCPLCHGRDFIHGIRGGYFCIVCQPGQHGELVKAEKR